MSDNTPQPNGTGPSGAPDPWAPPEDSANRVPLDKPGAGAPGGPYGNPVHDQPTVTSMPGAGTDGLPGAPTAPGAPGVPGAPAAYGYPSGAPTGAPGEYGYPPAYPGASTPGASPYPGYPGYTGYPGAGGWTGAAQPQNGFGVTAMVLGILSICLFCMYLGVILGPMALIFGILGRKKAARGEATNPGMALAGIITGSIGLAIGVVVIGLVVWSVASHS
ncbi:DUF4190 domain-containing protein [Streptomyces sp. NPDC087440]|uniref:DUF4190 domain-containing protein n=1 Tax=Streptomyces sp. NPDC087440 TaxID=3365790 RepID=UPI003803175B